MNRLLILAFLCISLFACKKENHCRQIQQSLYELNREESGAFINSFIQNLPSKKYNKPNLEILVAHINGFCDMTAKNLCFSCIKTLPEESEIDLSFNYSGTLITRTIDLSYRSDNTIIYVNVHE